jgi:hypothetical protein
MGIKKSVYFVPDVGKDYDYRNDSSMVPSAEWAVTFEDFAQPWIPTTAITNGPVANTPLPWQGAIIDSGATVAVNTTAALGANGVLTLADATASEGAAFYGQKSIQLTAGKRFYMEARIRTGDVTDNAVQFGLSDLTAVTNPEDLWTTVAANLVAFGILDGSAAVRMLADKSNSGSTAETGTRSLVADTWHTLAIYYDGSRLFGYVDGKEALTWSQAATTIPNGVALAPFIGHINGDGAGAAVVLVDYIRWASER